MTEKNLWMKLGLIVLLVGLSMWQVYPFSAEKLRPGIDLGGGHSLIFEIDTSGTGADDPELAQKVMTTLKQRVDPLGQRNLVWRPMGRNRLEIQIPKPPPDQAKKRENFENAKTAISKTNITETQIRDAMALPKSKRQEEFDRLAGTIARRKELFNQLAEALDQYEDMSAAMSQPATASAPSAEDARKMDAALEKRSATIRQLLETNLDVRVLTDLLELGPRSSIRKERLEAVKKSHPDLAGRIDELAAAHDVWAVKKGTLEDPADLIRLLKGAGVLEFRILATRSSGSPDTIDSSNPKYNEPISKYTQQLTKYGPRPRPGDNYRWFKIAGKQDKEWPDNYYIIQEYAGARYILAHSTPDMGLLHERPATWSLKEARQERDQTGRLSVGFELDVRGGKKFGDMTGANLKRPLCIFLDNDAISSATIQSQIFERGQITGTFSMEDVMYLVNTLNAGTLIASLKEVPLQEKSVGPTLGETNRRMGLRSVVWAMTLTILFMAVYYAYAGVVADVALMMNLVLTLGVMSFIQGTFTLPGIAGLILTLGMAVDANVLIYERMREELQRGVSVRMAVKLGYEKAFSAILDANVTTIMTAVILYAIGSEEIKGFGLTLGIGLATSMFTALFVTRQYFSVMIPPTLNSEEVRKCGVMVVGLALAAGAFLGLGYLIHSPADRVDSTMVGLGMFLAWMFGTAAVLVASLWIFRTVYRMTGHQKAGRLPMMKLMSAPNIDWMSKYKVCWIASGVVIVAGIIFMIDVDKKALLDIEFQGGTNVQIELLDQYKSMSDQDLQVYLNGGKSADASSPTHAAGWLRSAAGALAEAGVRKLGEARYEIAIPRGLNNAQTEALLMPVIGDLIERNGIVAGDGGLAVQFDTEKAAKEVPNEAAVKALLEQASRYVAAAAGKIADAKIQSIEEGGSDQARRAFEIVTTETNRGVVEAALVAAMGDPQRGEILKVTRSIDATLVRDTQAGTDGVHPIPVDALVLSDVIGGTSNESVVDYKGGVALIFDHISPPQTIKQLKQRIDDMRFQPDFESVISHRYTIVGLESQATESGEPAYTKIVYLAVDPNLQYDPTSPSNWRTEVADRELAMVQAAFANTRSLQRVTQFAPQVAAEASQKAVIAMVLSLIAIAGYLWLRFGTIEYGLAGIVALYHDVAMALSCTMLCHYIHDTWFGRMLLLEDFKIDLNLIAALLTIVGFSINDTIVIFDRIRENRGRMATISSQLVNRSLNETLSRTIITTLTVFAVVLVMYFAGGKGIHGFAFAMIIGSISGTYSTLAIATPLVLHRRVLYGVTIVLGGLTAAGVVWMIPSTVIRTFLLVIIVAASVYGLYRQMQSTGGDETGNRRTALPVA